jgi:hypothetical protein
MKVWMVNSKVMVSGKSGSARITGTVNRTVYLDRSCLVNTKVKFYYFYGCNKSSDKPGANPIYKIL